MVNPHDLRNIIDVVSGVREGALPIEALDPALRKLLDEAAHNHVRKGAPVPANFGGLIAYWYNRHVYLVRYGYGEPVEGIGLTALNALQAVKTLGGIIEEGKRLGYVTEEHERQSEQLPTTPTRDFSNVKPRSEVDDIAGPG